MQGDGEGASDRRTIAPNVAATSTCSGERIDRPRRDLRVSPHRRVREGDGRRHADIDGSVVVCPANAPEAKSERAVAMRKLEYVLKRRRGDGQVRS